MKKPSKALVNKLQEFSFNQKSIDELDLFKQQGNIFHLIHENNSHHADLIDSDFLNRTYSIRVNSNIYNVKIQRPIDDAVQKMGYALRSAKTVDSIKAPMPGIIIDLKVEKGQKIKKGDTLLILEAMKMENAIVSPKDTTIKEVYTTVGETVDKNKLLIDFE
ncbi:acetyl-CoA carboxylase biotin carboxyl carrier protein subunit [Lutimonas halocynthiae]|uniref:acetyl-CoA carboxylase biotin carboxyl carrier protein subunit n=1 Tax=Lutimonas halocynthiae TaxID=1446477 RepID=UPI0025B5CCA3|nr:acetyl-CoA carboxylase biotin carboxyl carrier protein subunit [Lutimonas halocynthiae]MDN3641764.1 acetyl-CoA carboxylase biotin carboxyl carrier protein subunit [Lutimonas halocynthiae]